MVLRETTLALSCDCRFVQVAATHYNHMSSACIQTGKVFMWGQCRGQSVTSPLETHFNSIHDVFACFASPPVTWTTLEVGETPSGTGALSPRGSLGFPK